MPVVNNIQALTYALDLSMEKHQNIVIYGENVGFKGGVLSCYSWSASKIW